MTEHFSIEPTVEAEESLDPQFSFDPTPEVDPLADVPVSEEQIQTRAQKADIAEQGFEDRSVEGQALNADEIRAGFEGIQRDRLLAKADIQERQFKREFILEASNNTNFSPSTEAIQEFLAFTPDEITNPQTITESLFAKEMISNLPSSAASIEEDPAAHEEMFQFVAGNIRKKEYLQHKLEEIEKRRGERGFFESAQNLAGEFLPGRDRILQRGAQTEAGQQGPGE